MLYLIIILVIIFLSYKLIDRHTHDIEINRKTLKSKNVNNDFTILHLSDLHFNFNKKYQDKIVNLINKLDYDLITITGDYLNGEEYLVNLDMFLKKLENNKPIYAVLGNNDQKFKKEIIDLFNDNNIYLLNNQNEKHILSDSYINIIGVDTPDLDKDDYNKAIKDINLKDNFNLLLSHTYHITDKKSLDNIDLVLVGDTHGGQINLPLLNKIANRKFELKFRNGLYKLKDNKTLIVNKGIGTNILPFRINCKPELVLINIYKND